MAKPTSQEIKKEVKTLKDYRERVRPLTAFGDSNKDAISVQVQVLEENMSEDDIWDTWDADLDERLVACATEAFEWLIGRRKEKPSLDWKSLLKSK